MKKHIIYIGLFAICLIFITAYGTSVCNKDEIQTTQEAQSEYTMKDYNGRIAIFREGNSKPIEIFEIQTASLPQENIEQLMAGISATSYDELLRIVGDYTS